MNTNSTMDKNPKTNSDTNPIAIATVIQVQAPTSAKPGDKALVGKNGVLHGWVGGGCVQPAVAKLSKAVLASGQPTMLRVAPDGLWEPVEGVVDYASSCLGRGSLLLFIEPLHTQPTLCVMGSSAVALSLAHQALNLKLNVILQAPKAEQQNIASQIDFHQQFDPVHADYIVIATQGSGDKLAISNAMKSDCEHVSMVVSERKLVALKERLLADGFQKAALDRLKGQAGLRIGAQLPEEIALSILAEIVQLRRASSTQLAAAPSQSEPMSTQSEYVASDASTADQKGCCGG